MFPNTQVSLLKGWQMKINDYHEPVLVKEVLEAFLLNAPLKNQVRMIDATLGTGGHTLEMVKRGAFILGLEADAEMIKTAQKRLEDEGLNNFKLVQGNFRNIDKLARQSNFNDVNGILFDLGVSNPQLTSEKRGFSFSNPEADLDMRIAPTDQALKASDLLNVLRYDQLVELFLKVVDRNSSQRIAKEILRIREEKPIKKVGDFLKICDVIKGKPGLNQATLPFLALRISVNSELDNLFEALPKALDLLKPAGRLTVITFHSGEDEIVKDFFRDAENKNLARIINKQPIKASEEEIFKNQKSRSAKLRILEKI